MRIEFLRREGEDGRTLGHAQVRSHDKHKLALLAGVLGLLSNKPLLTVCLATIGPVGRMVHDGIVIDVALFALDGIVQVAVALLSQARGDEVATDGIDPKEVAAEEGNDGRAYDEAVVLGGGVHGWEGRLRWLKNVGDGQTWWRVWRFGGEYLDPQVLLQNPCL